MDNAATLRRGYDLINAGDIDGFLELLSEDFVEHEETPGISPTKAGVRDFFRANLAAFPDMRFDALDVLASGDKVVGRIRVTGTHRGAFMGIAPTGNSFDVQAIDIARFGDDGLVHEHWGVVDSMGMMQQLGLGPGGPPG